MQKISQFAFVLLLIILSEGPTSPAHAQGLKGEDIREPAFAGTWYDGDKEVLTRSIKDFLSRARGASAAGDLKAVMVPHAGHRFSGEIAAHAYQLVAARDIRRVVLVGPSHRVPLRGVSVNLQSGYRTPLGVVPVDQALAGKLLKSLPQASFVREAHANEHSLEIQLPFLQTVVKDLRIVTILMGRLDMEACTQLGKALARAIKGEEKMLLVASTDLSHFHNSRRAAELDQEFIKHVQAFDPEALAGSMLSGKCEACGGGPAVTVMVAARELGADRAVILKYGHSGEVSGDHREVVGYLSAAFLKAP